MAGFGELENVNDSNGARAPIRSAWSGVKPTEEEKRGDRHSFEDGHGDHCRQENSTWDVAGRGAGS